MEESSTSLTFGQWLGARIAELKEAARKAKAKKVTHQSIADAVGVSRPTVANWIEGSIPSADKVVPLARALGVTIAEVLTAIGTPPEGEGNGGTFYTLPGKVAAPGVGEPTPKGGHFKGPVLLRMSTRDGRVISEHRADGYQVGDPVEIVVDGA